MPKKPRGRPSKKYPPRVEATAEGIAKAFFAMHADHKWEYLESEPEYRCIACGESVHYPDTLYNDGRCKSCHSTASS